MVFLRFVGYPGFQSSIGEDIGIDQSTVSRIIAEVAEKIIIRKEEWIKWYAIDCTHVGIKKPSMHSDEFINRKGFNSINIQATCDGAEMFTSEDISWPLSVHDSRIFKNLDIYLTLLESSTSVLIVDEGYGLTAFLMTPYRNPVSAGEYKLRVATRIATKVILACFILNNISKAFQSADENTNKNGQEEAAMDIEEQYLSHLFPSNNSSRRDILLREAGQIK
ncbi:putative nuclease HARBI1 [Eupeodes corollae]|uniref:putative nuclease HARBI1 n=1 Tax=Eupeodes corollae TaxID=290404 RepID=UPI0024923682|nr:putative nuclease HARBI1 [Eupeodes corollae]